MTLLLYLLLYFDISSLTVGILRSRCIASLVTYHGAFIIDYLRINLYFSLPNIDI